MPQSETAESNGEAVVNTRSLFEYKKPAAIYTDALTYYDAVVNAVVVAPER